MKWDLKSIITLILVCVLALITVGLIVAVVIGALPSDDKTVNAIVLLFSNVVTMVFTYFFTRKESHNESK